jgi:ribonuclease HII
VLSTSACLFVMFPNLTLELAFWRDGYQYIAGLDEVGRGAWAGPVVAGAVIFPAVSARTAHVWAHSVKFRALARVNDSKQLSPSLREDLYEPIRASALGCATAAATHAEVDALGIVRASHLAMRRALEALPLPPDALLIDALVLPELEIPQQGIIHGDAISLSIAAASILAKVTRDRFMCELDASIPGYNFARHKGYGTSEHSAALRACGPSPVHRFSFAPISRMASLLPPASEGDPGIADQ